jgi:hypothetical protein
VAKQDGWIARHYASLSATFSAVIRGAFPHDAKSQYFENAKMVLVVVSENRKRKWSALVDDFRTFLASGTAFEGLQTYV